MKPEEHYRRARSLVAEAEAFYSSLGGMELIRLAGVHAQLGQLAETIGDAQTFLSSSLLTRVVLTIPPGVDTARVLDALNEQLGILVTGAESLARHNIDGEGPVYSAAAQAIRGRTVWEGDDDTMRRFAATDDGTSAP